MAAQKSDMTLQMMHLNYASNGSMSDVVILVNRKTVDDDGHELDPVPIESRLTTAVFNAKMIALLPEANPIATAEIVRQAVLAAAAQQTEAETTDFMIVSVEPWFTEDEQIETIHVDSLRVAKYPDGSIAPSTRFQFEVSQEDFFSLTVALVPESNPSETTALIVSTVLNLAVDIANDILPENR